MSPGQRAAASPLMGSAQVSIPFFLNLLTSTASPNNPDRRDADLFIPQTTVLGRQIPGGPKLEPDKGGGQAFDFDGTAKKIQPKRSD